MDIKNISFGARVNVDYSRRSGEIKPAVEQLARGLRKIGDDEIVYDIVGRKNFVSVKAWTWNQFWEEVRQLGKFQVKGKKALNGDFLLRLAKAKTFVQDIADGYY